ncbi:MAG: hypothetical protein WD934_06990 [Gemmatimonadales bacterium]
MRSILFALFLAPALAAQQPRDLSGSWVLDRQPPAADSTAVAAGQTAAGPRTAGTRQLSLLIGIAGAVPAFSVTQTDTSVTVTNADGFSYLLRPDGPELQLTIADSLVVRYRARWDGSFLQVEFRPNGGGKVTERYQLADSELYLRVDVTVEYERFRRQESRLYRRNGSAGT